MRRILHCDDSNGVAAVRAAPDIDACIREICTQFRIDHVAYHMASHAASSIDKPYVRTNYSETWIGRYLLMGYIDIDPVARAGFAGGGPKEWAELDWSGARVEAFAQDAVAHGISPNGYLVPISDRFHRRAQANFSAHKEPDEWKSCLQEIAGDLKKCALILHDLAVCENFEEQESGTHLTPRELQCLTLAANGNDGGQIARLLGISEYTVRDYFKAARWKLGCSSLVHSVHKATCLGLIKIDLAEPQK